MRSLLALGAICTVAAQPATAQSIKLLPDDLHSARCALVAAMIPDEVTEVQRTAGIVYFFGKLRGRLPDTSLNDIFSRELILDVADNSEKYRAACGQELMLVGPEMSSLGKRIIAIADEPSAIKPEQ